MTDLWPHQQHTVAFGLDRERVFDGSDPGTGKTRAHLELFHRRRARGLTDKLLVVCPRTLMDAAWGEDLRRFYPDLRFGLATAAQREQVLEDPRLDVVILNTDGVSALAKRGQAWVLHHFGKTASLIVDESTAFKNIDAARTKALLAVSPCFTYRALLTATATPNTVMELWSQLLILDDGERLGTSYYQLRPQLQMQQPDGARRRWVDKPYATAVVSLLIGDLTIRHAFDTVMTWVPPIYARTLHFDLPPPLRRAYRELEARSRLQLESGTVTALNAAVLANKLLQVASGSVYDSTGQPALLTSDRYELIADLIEERDHSLVFWSWTHQKDELSKLLTTRGLTHALLDGTTPDTERARIVADYQAGHFRTLLLHPRTGAHGLTLTRGRAVIWASPRYEADFMIQGLHRIRRGTQDQTTENLMIAARATLEPQVYATLGAKVSAMSDLLALMKAA